jgi:hypothetical protein
MKCPKCGYVSFDHHQVCQKCGKDVLAEQRRLNLPDYKPDPPSFLGALTGEGGPAPAVSASLQEPGATIEFDGALQSAARDDALSSAMKISAASAGPAISSVPDKAPHDELELDLDELSLDLDEGGGQREPGPFQFETRATEEDAISLDLGDLNAKEEAKPSNGGPAATDLGKLDKTLALEGMPDLEENQMGLNTAEMLTLELDRKLDAASSEMAEDELDEFEFDIDLEELKEVKD